MKYSYLALAAMISSFGLLACSDDPQPSQGVDGQSSDSLGGTPVDGSSSSMVAVDDPNAAIPSVKNEAVASQTVSVSGYAGSGPFVKGSSVSIIGVDPSTLASVGTAVSAVTLSDKGDFALQGAISSQYALVEATGQYYSFFLDDNTGPMTLQALTNVKGRTTVNVNILTHIEAARVKNLIAFEGMTFSDAKIKADKEIRLALGLPSDSTLFEDLSLLSTDQGGVNLLAMSAVVTNEREGAQAQTVLQAITDDIALDGKWDDSVMKALLGDEAYEMTVSLGSSFLGSKMGVKIPFFEGSVNSFWGIAYGLGFCLEEYTVLPNTTVGSANVGKSFICRDGNWAIATAEFLDGVAMAEVFGACNASVEGVIKENAGKSYICKKNFWFTATESEIANASIAATTGACDDTKRGNLSAYNSKYFVCIPPSWTAALNVPVDYSQGRAMNKKLGKGINFGNSWDAPGTGDGGWSNPIGDGDFATAKAAGFNSVRIPVRWSAGVDAQLSGVKADVQLALNAGLTVIVNSHHHDNLYNAAKSGNFSGALQNFANEWKKVAQAFDSFPDDALVFEIFNEPHDMTQEQVDQIMTTGYNAIRSVSKGKTIMFEGNNYAKFAQISKVTLPADGNIIFTGHYYEPYSYSHQGEHGNGCEGDGAYNNRAASDMKSYVDLAMEAYPDINGGHVPLNMGEFGVAKVCGVTDAKRSQWAKLTVEAAEAADISWNYWCFKNCGGFEAWNGSWMSGFLSAFGLK